ncbi:PQQ-binding-like beta-propeller repeat protein [Streptomyces sp. NPDC059618]|uniref:outer membrane protein assembly factor BamB family protein n=1 Tax=Streptomyces sp. NPDC059618 TaxID=3346887 RepID=UPI00367CB5A2
MTQRLIAGRYGLERLLGRGGMGEVWAARDHVMLRPVAIKLVHNHLGTGEGEKLFLREARTAGALSHPGIVTVHDIGRDDDGTFYLVMERVPGRDLAVVLQDGPPAVADAVGWTAQVADALHVAHEARVLHRDLKPANLILTPTGSVKILDFGIARWVGTRSMASRVVGTIAYMPPERLQGKVGDARGDLYALGCVLYELLTGRTPFGSLDPVALLYAHIHTTPAMASTYRPDVPPHLDALLAELLAKEPDQRPADAIAVRDRLNHPPEAPTPAPTVWDMNRTVRGGVHLSPGRPRTSRPSVQPWTYATGAEVTSSPAVVDGIVYIGSFDHKVYALDAATGAVRWTHTTGGKVGSSPTVVDGTVYIGSDDWKVYALDAATGDVRWTHTVFDPGMFPNIGFRSSPTVVNGIVYISGTYGEMHALDAATGTPRWAQRTSPGLNSSPAVVNGTLYIGGFERVYALDAATGDVRWTHKGRVARWTHLISYGIDSSPAVVDDTVYIGGTDGEMHALDAATGTPRWMHIIGHLVRSSPAVVDGTVYVGSDDRRVYALDAATGGIRWVHTTGSGVNSSPAVVDGTVYVGSFDHKVYALDAATGDVRWTHTTGAEVVSSPAVVDGIVYIGSANGTVYALDAATGRTSEP